MSMFHRQVLSEEVKQNKLPAEVCKAALDGVQGVLPYVSPSRRAALLTAVTALSSKSAARTAARAACLFFQQSLMTQGGQVLFAKSASEGPLLPEAVLIEWLQARLTSCCSVFKAKQKDANAQ